MSDHKRQLDLQKNNYLVKLRKLRYGCSLCCWSKSTSIDGLPLAAPCKLDADNDFDEAACACETASWIYKSKQGLQDS